MKACLYIKDKRLCSGTEQIAVLTIDEVEEIQRIFVRVRVYNPIGVRNQLFNESIVVIPGISKNIHFKLDTSDQPHGVFRFEIRLFTEGLLQLTETVEDDFFYLDSIAVEPVEINEKEMNLKLKNLSPEKTPFMIVQDGNVYNYELSGESDMTLSLPISSVYLCYANSEINVTKQLIGGEVFYRLHRLFWREESDNTVFVYDPKAEGKKRLVLGGFAKELWDLSDGVTTHFLESEEMDIMDQILKYKIINKIN